MIYICVKKQERERERQRQRQRERGKKRVENDVPQESTSWNF